jgi:hypothetical protein
MVDIHSPYIVLLGQGPNERDNLETSSGIQTTGWLIEEQDFWGCNQLACYADTALLSITNPLPDWCSNDSVFLLPETKRINQVIDSHDTLFLCKAMKDFKLACSVR